MTARLSDTLLGLISDLRYEPTLKRVRGDLDGTTIVDTRGALLVWEPKRVTPIFAVPEQELRAQVTPASGEAAGEEYPVAIMLEGPPVLDPRTPFSRHTTTGTPLDVSVGGTSLQGAAFRPDDAALAGYLLLDFDALQWREDDEPIIGHPRDPFHRIDIRRSSDQITVQCEGTTLAETSRAARLYETLLPPRLYIPPSDVRLDMLEPSATRTVCPYKGEAGYFSYPGSPKGRDIAWQYDSRFLDATQIHGLVCFFDERVDVTVNGVEQGRPVTPWA
jgi:uncharacterized protein (DUF427 family)